MRLVTVADEQKIYDKGAKDGVIAFLKESICEVDPSATYDGVQIIKGFKAALKGIDKL